jgi:Tol biopolymer transport system component
MAANDEAGHLITTPPGETIICFESIAWLTVTEFLNYPDVLRAIMSSRVKKGLGFVIFLVLLLITFLLWPRFTELQTPIAFIYYEPGGTVRLDAISGDGHERTTLVDSRPSPGWLDTLASRLPISQNSGSLLVQHADTMRSPVWIQDPPVLAYQSREIGVYCERVRRIQPQGGEPEDVACLPADLKEDAFGWAPDGSVFAYADQDSGGVGLWILASDGKVLLRSELLSTIWGISWSPDSRFLAVNLTGEIGIRVFSSEGFQFLIDTPDYARGVPVWSPDGNTIAFLCASWVIDQMDICSISLDGTRFQRATFDEDFPYIKKSLIWSPSGDRLAFAATQGQEFNDIYLVNPDGTDLLQLTNHPASDSEPAWSPDGSTLVYSSNRDGNWELYSIMADGTGLTRLTETPGDEHEPVWRPDWGNEP